MPESFAKRCGSMFQLEAGLDDGELMESWPQARAECRNGTFIVPRA